MKTPDKQASKQPAHERAYLRLREMVLFGELAPGQPVTIQGLVDATGSGMTPVREAIRRLTAERALVATGTRRVLVPELNAGQLSEIAFARNAIEPQLATLAMDHMTADRIDMLVAVDDALNNAIAAGDVHGYLRLNHDFHHLIYDTARAPILSSMADALWLRVGPSLRVVCGRMGTLNLPDKHDEALAAMRAGDTPAVCAAIRADIEQGHAQIRRSFDVK